MNKLNPRMTLRELDRESIAMIGQYLLDELELLFGCYEGRFVLSLPGQVHKLMAGRTDIEVQAIDPSCTVQDLMNLAAATKKQGGIPDKIPGLFNAKQHQN